MYDVLLETVKKAKQGDRNAYTELYYKTERMVFYTALKFTGSEDAAWEIAQNTYVKVYEGLRNLREEAAFITWLQKIVINQSKEYWRKHRPALFSSSEDE
jgi:RNA polymerase sigma-70 factor (ECF subfamily)